MRPADHPLVTEARLGPEFECRSNEMSTCFVQNWTGLACPLRRSGLYVHVPPTTIFSYEEINIRRSPAGWLLHVTEKYLLSCLTPSLRRQHGLQHFRWAFHRRKEDNRQSYSLPESSFGHRARGRAPARGWKSSRRNGPTLT